MARDQRGRCDDAVMDPKRNPYYQAAAAV